MATSQSQRLRRMAEKASRRKDVVAEKRKADTVMIGGTRGTSNQRGGALADQGLCGGGPALRRRHRLGGVGANLTVGTRRRELFPRRRVVPWSLRMRFSRSTHRRNSQTEWLRRTKINRSSILIRRLRANCCTTPLPTRVLSVLRRAKASLRLKRFSVTFPLRRKHFRSARMANHSMRPVQRTWPHAYDGSLTRSLNALAKAVLTTLSMWTILLDGHDLLLLRDSWRRARIAGLTKEHRSSSRLAPFPCSMN